LPVVPIKALEGLDLISFRRGAGLRAAADRVFESEGVSPNIVIESNEMPLLLGLVASRLGVAVLPRQFVAEPRANIWSRPLSPSIRPSLALAWREGRRFPPAAEAFLRHVVRVAVTARP
jgi:DNA-binding transcriptional LysR family regulator